MLSPGVAWRLPVLAPRFGSPISLAPLTSGRLGRLTNSGRYPRWGSSWHMWRTGTTAQSARPRFLVATCNPGFGQVLLAVYVIGIFAAPTLMGLPCGEAGAYRAGWRSCS